MQKNKKDCREKIVKFAISIIALTFSGVVEGNIFANNAGELNFSTEKYDVIEDITKNFSRITHDLADSSEKIIHPKKATTKTAVKTTKTKKVEKKPAVVVKADPVKNKKAFVNAEKVINSNNESVKNREKIIDIKPSQDIDYSKVSSAIIPNSVRNGHQTATCWDSAGKHYGIDPWLLYSIAYVESGFNPNAIGKNKNGTKDLGMMQINDKVWLPKLAKEGITKNMLKDPCVSIYVGAWILKQNINRLGYTKRAIGAYNSMTPHINKRYSDKVYLAYAKLTKLHKIQTTNK